MACRSTCLPCSSSLPAVSSVPTFALRLTPSNALVAVASYPSTLAAFHLSLRFAKLPSVARISNVTPFVKLCVSFQLFCAVSRSACSKMYGETGYHGAYMPGHSEVGSGMHRSASEFQPYQCLSNVFACAPNLAICSCC